MKSFNLYVLCLCIVNSASAETALAAAVANDHAASQAQQAPAPIAPESKETPVTDAFIDLAIPLNCGYNFPAPGLKMDLYPQVDNHITVESEITIQEDEVTHPLIAKILAIIGYEKTQCGYFFCSEPTASKSDASTKVVSIKKPYRFSPQEVHIKLRTLLNPEQAAKYRATIEARMKRTQQDASQNNIALKSQMILCNPGR